MIHRDHDDWLICWWDRGSQRSSIFLDRGIAMDVLMQVGMLWVAAAAAMTLGLARAAAHEEPFQVEGPSALVVD